MSNWEHTREELEGTATMESPVQVALWEAQETINALHTILVRLLDDPIWGRNGDHVCVFCEEIQDYEAHHHPWCPVLRRDELLGR